MPPKITAAPRPAIPTKPVYTLSKDPAVPALLGEHIAGGMGVEGLSDTGQGVYGWSPDGQGVSGESQNNEGVRGVSHSAGHAGVVAINDNRTENAGPGVNAVSTNGEAVHAETQSSQLAAIAAFNLNPNGLGAAVFGHKAGTVGHAGFFDGNVNVVGELTVGVDIKLFNAGDCAEEFQVSESHPPEPGTVMVLGPDAILFESERAYDRRVAGVISGGGTYRTGIVLDRRDSQNRKPIALLGKVFCKADADYAPIEIGDLLTTSNTPGHAMKVSDSARAFGSVMGKALGALPHGRGLIPILVTLQ